MIRFADFEKALLGANADCVAEKPLQQPAPQSAPARRCGDRQVEELRLARREHQHAIRHDAAVLLADKRSIARRKGIAEIALRPWRRVRGLLERRDRGQILFAHRPPSHARFDARLDAGAHCGRLKARSEVVSATL